MLTHAHTHAHARTHAHTHARTHTHTHTHTHTEYKYNAHTEIKSSLLQQSSLNLLLATSDQVPGDLMEYAGFTLARTHSNAWGGRSISSDDNLQRESV